MALRPAVLASMLGVSLLWTAEASALVQVGELQTAGLGQSIAVADGLAYVAGQVFTPDFSILGTLRVIDLSDPAAPLQIGALDLVDFPAVDVEVVGGLAYVTRDGLLGGLRVVDVSDPGAPAEIGRLDFDFGYFSIRGQARGLEVVGGLAYLLYEVSVDLPCDCRRNLRVIDVSDPTAPVEVGSFETVAVAQDLSVVASRAYVVSVPGFRDPGPGGSVVPPGLQVIDVSDPAAPVEIGFLPNLAGYDQVAVVDGLAYVAGRGLIITSTGVRFSTTGALRVIDVSNPAAPFEIGAVSAPLASDLEVVSGFAYLALSNGVQVIDVSDPVAPVRLGAIGADAIDGRWWATWRSSPASAS